MNVTNTHKTPLALPGGTVLEPNSPATVNGWDTIKKNACVAAWVKAGILVEDGKAAGTPVPAASTVGVPDKAELQAKLDALNVQYDKRAGVAKLQALLAEAEANRPPLAILHGSDKLPAHIEIAEGKTVQLGTVVAEAHTASGLSEEAWNALPADERDALLNAEIDRLKAAEQASED